MRTLVIGDIHGSLRGLKQILERAKVTTDDKLIFLGDYVDGWSESAQVIEFLIKLNKAHNCIFIKGNHDEWCKGWLVRGVKHPYWLPQGGQATYDSYLDTGFINDDHKDFFRNLKNYHIDDKNRGFVHGGFTSKKGLGNEPYESNYYWDRDLWELAVSLNETFNKSLEDEDYDEFYRPNPYRFLKHTELYIGHTNTTAWKVKPHLKEYNDSNQPKNGSIIVPMNRCNVWNVDTGAGFNGKLTIMDIDTKQYWQSDYSKELYKNEKGR